jgi:hypothetical protein
MCLNFCKTLLFLYSVVFNYKLANYPSLVEGQRSWLTAGGEDSGDAPKLWWLEATDEAEEDEELDGVSSSVLLWLLWFGEEAEQGSEFWMFGVRSRRAFFSEGCRPG